MENNDLLSGQSHHEQSVTIPLAEYKTLLQTQATAANPVLANSPISPNPAEAPLRQKYSRSEILLFILAIAVVLSFILPVGPMLFLPFILFVFLGARAFFKDASSNNNRSKSANAAIFIFKIIAVIGIGLAATYMAVIAFFIALFSIGGGPRS